VKKILIIYPHFPPSNLAGVHRARLFSQHLHEFGWEPTILTVKEEFYEEALDYNLTKLLPADLKIEKVNSFGITKPRLIGDIGLRAFFQLYKRAKDLINENNYDFLYIPIPSFYCALLGPLLHKKTKIKYGIDYIDPWVHKFPGSEKMFSRAWLSAKIANALEKYSVKNASLITGVAEGYYLPVIQRNPHLSSQLISGAMPYGGEVTDHQILKTLSLKPYLFRKKAGKKLFVYAGAMLPKAYQPLEAIFKSIAANRKEFINTEYIFIGSGSRANDPESYNIKPLAEKYGLWNSVVFEFPQRIPYFDVLVHLQEADAVFILGSTEPHYTPSKTYQGVLSEKPIMAILHTDSTAVDIIRKSAAGQVLDFNGEADIESITNSFFQFYKRFILFMNKFEPCNVNREVFELYSAKAVTGKLSELLNKIPLNEK